MRLTLALPADTVQRLKSMTYSGALKVDQRLAQRGLHALAAWNSENHFRAWRPREICKGRLPP